MNGVAYLLSGEKSAELLVLSLWTLRQYYNGPVTIFYVKTGHVGNVVDAIRNDKRLHVTTQRTETVGDAVFPKWIPKIFLFHATPYRNTLYLDADTTIHASPEPLFANDTFKLAKTLHGVRIRDDHRFATQTRRRILRFKRFGPVMKQMVSEVYRDNCYVVNTGMMMFLHRHRILWELHHLIYGWRQFGLSDERTMNMIMPHCVDDIEFVDGEWNSLVRYDENWKQAKIIHWHHKYWNEPVFADEWRSLFSEVIEHNVANIRHWCGLCNYRMKHFQNVYTR